MCQSDIGGLLIYYLKHNQYFSPLGAFSGSGWVHLLTFFLAAFTAKPFLAHSGC